MKTTCDDPADRDDSLRYAAAPRRQIRLRWQKLLEGPRPGPRPRWTFNWHDDRASTNSIRFHDEMRRRRGCFSGGGASPVAWQRDDARYGRMRRPNAALDGHYQFTVYRGWVHRNEVDRLSPAIQQFALLLRDLSLIWQASIGLKDCRGGTLTAKLPATKTKQAA